MSCHVMSCLDVFDAGIATIRYLSCDILSPFSRLSSFWSLHCIMIMTFQFVSSRTKVLLPLLNIMNLMSNLTITHCLDIDSTLTMHSSPWCLEWIQSGYYGQFSFLTAKAVILFMLDQQAIVGWRCQYLGDKALAR